MDKIYRDFIQLSIIHTLLCISPTGIYIRSLGYIYMNICIIDYWTLDTWIFT